jgi:hypothetical protein
MKTTCKILIVTGLFLALGIISCNKDEKDPSTLSLNNTEVTGNVGDNFTVKVTTTGDEITTVKVTKFLDGTADADFTPVTASISNSAYDYAGSIAPSDVLAGAVLYTFTGYNAAGAEVDAADLTVTINLTGTALLLKYDWRRTSRLITWPALGLEEVEDIKDPEKEYIYRFNPDYSWQFDWGSTAPALPSIYCAWKPISSATNPVDSLILVRYDANDERSDEAGKVTKLTKDELWIKIYTEAWDLTEEQKYVAVAKSPNFKPYGGADPGDYVSQNCNPGSY